MGNVNAYGSDIAAIVGTIDPDAYTTGEENTTWADMSLFHSMTAILQVGNLSTSATVDFKLEEATNSTGGGAQDITMRTSTEVKDITQLTTSSTDVQVVINVRSQELDVEDSYRYVRATMTVSVNSADCSALLLGFSPRFGPASDNDNATVTEIISS